MPIEKVTTRQIIGFLIISRLSFAISRMPTIDNPPYNQDQWFMIIVSIFYIMIAASPLLFLANKFNDYSVVGYLKIIYGEKLGNTIAVFYGFNFIANCVNSLTLQTELVTTSILADASNLLISTVMIVTCMYIASKGIINIARGADLFFPVSLGIIIALILLGLNNVDFSLLTPILKESTFMDINMGAMKLSTIFTDIFLLVMIIPELENKKDINKIFTTVVIISLFLLIIAVVVVQGSLGLIYTRHSVFPFLIYTRLIDAFDIVERIDSIFVTTWLITSTARITGLIYISTRVYREILNKKEDEKVILFIVGIITLAASLFIIQRRPVVGIRQDFDLYLGILFAIFVVSIPTITCIVYFFRRKSIEEKVKMKINNKN